MDEKRKNVKFWKEISTAMILFGSIARMLFWAAQPFWYQKLMPLPASVNVYWNFIPSMVFIGSYLVILFLWMKIFHQRDLRNLYITVLSILFFFEFVLIAADITLSPEDVSQRVPQGATTLQQAIIVYTGATYLLISLAFLYYGTRIYCQGLTPPNILPHLIILTILCWILLTLRGAFVLWNSTAPWEDSLFWWVDITYFGLLEVLPIVLMLVVFKSAPAQ